MKFLELAFSLELNANTSMATWDGNVFSTAAIWQWKHDSITWLWGRCLQQIIKLRNDCEMRVCARFTENSWSQELGKHKGRRDTSFQGTEHGESGDHHNHFDSFSWHCEISKM